MYDVQVFSALSLYLHKEQGAILSLSSHHYPVNMLVCADWADAASIGPVQARYWQLMAFLQGLA